MSRKLSVLFAFGLIAASTCALADDCSIGRSHFTCETQIEGAPVHHWDEGCSVSCSDGQTAVCSPATCGPFQDGSAQSSSCSCQ